VPAVFVWRREALPLYCRCGDTTACLYPSNGSEVLRRPHQPAPHSLPLVARGGLELGPQLDRMGEAPSGSVRGITRAAVIQSESHYSHFLPISTLQNSQMPNGLYCRRWDTRLSEHWERSPSQ
jgi:hypothetical protein